MAIEEIANMIAEQEPVQNTTGNPALDELAQSARAQIEKSQEEAQQMQPEVVQENVEAKNAQVQETAEVQVETNATEQKDWWDSSEEKSESTVSEKTEKSKVKLLKWTMTLNY